MMVKRRNNDGGRVEHMVEQRNSDTGRVKQRRWNSGTEMVEQWTNDGGTEEQ